MIVDKENDLKFNKVEGALEKSIIDNTDDKQQEPEEEESFFKKMLKKVCFPLDF